MIKDTTARPDVKAPSLADIEAIADRELARIPDPLAIHAKGLVVRIADFADDDVLDELGLESPFDLLGLYQGTALPHQTTGHVAHDVDMVFLYRRPILDLWAEGEDTLGAIIRHVLIHEIGHHFGFSDADMEAIEASAE